MSNPLPTSADPREIPQARSAPFDIEQPRTRVHVHEAGAPVSILARSAFACAWITGTDIAGLATVCGEPVAGEGSWCPAHRTRVFTPAGRREQ